MKINYKGQEIEAYSLVMNRNNALDILNGKKCIETRMLSLNMRKCSRTSIRLRKMKN